MPKKQPITNWPVEAKKSSTAPQEFSAPPMPSDERTYVYMAAMRYVCLDEEIAWRSPYIFATEALAQADCDEQNNRRMGNPFQVTKIELRSKA